MRNGWLPGLVNSAFDWHPMGLCFVGLISRRFATNSKFECDGFKVPVFKVWDAPFFETAVTSCHCNLRSHLIPNHLLGRADQAEEARNLDVDINRSNPGGVHDGGPGPELLKLFRTPQPTRSRLAGDRHKPQRD
jgi:hypothetical protein